jgi:hypothetical protein
MIFSIIFLILAILLLAWAWMTSIEKMKDNNEDDDWGDLSQETLIGDDEWDNKHHNEDV